MDGREIPLEDLRWLRTLAAHLVHDPHAADDAVQETVLTALTRRPRDARSLRSWLRAILRNVLRQEWRQRARRARHEARLEPRPAAPSAAELVEEVALHRRLIEQVHALDEPYHAVIVLRFLHERTPREIAQDLGLTTKAVHTRIERALAKLRERLAADRRAWLLCLRPWRRPARPAWLRPALQFSALLVGTALVARPVRVDARAAELSAPGPARAPSEARLETAGAPASDAWLARRRPLPTGPAVAALPSAGDEPAGPAANELVSGLVCTLDGEPVPGLAVRFEREQREPWGASYALDPLVSGVESDARGRFALPLPRARGRLTVASESFASVHRPHLDGTPPRETPVLLVGPRRAYEGRVVDGSGAALEDASVEVLRGDSYLQLVDVGGELVNWMMPLAEQRTDAQGAFRLVAVGFVEGAELVVRRSGFELGRFPLPPLSRGGLELVLAPLAASARTVRGLVLDASGAPAPGAAVSAGDEWVRAGSDGRFVLALAPGEDNARLRALRPGSLPAEESLEALLPAREVVLRLGSAPFSIEGLVLAPDGTPLAGARVWTSALTPFGWSLQSAGEDWFLWQTSVEALLSGQGGVADGVVSAITDEQGRFELAGLLERPYALFALDPRTLDGCGPQALAAGERGVRLHLRRTARGPRAGRVVSLAGEPLAGVSVVPGLAFPLDDGPARTTSFAEDAAVLTGADGSFSFPALPVSGVCLSVRGAELLESELFQGDEAELRVPRGARFHLRLADAERADSFALLDAEERAGALLVEAAGRSFGVPRAALVGGRSGLARAAEGEHVVVLYKGGVEVRRARVRLAAGGPHEVGL